KLVRATRITYVGALGWELYVPWSDAPSVYAAIAESEPVHAGYHAMDSLRMEKAYRHWGHDITDEDTPMEAGLSFTVDWNKPDGFIGREALQEQRASGVRKRLGLFMLEDPEPLLYHDEPIWKDGKRVGHITSGAFAHTLGKSLGFGYLTSNEPITRKAMRESQFKIEIGDKMFDATCLLRAPFDPDNARILC
ncbi:MAG: FAD-dependent oxidoreductase, partial [Gammaproteobacteria bacterium]|nr:FAD-dependent oxidoreductase [Gammaproteobacteria bacterium]